MLQIKLYYINYKYIKLANVLIVAKYQSSCLTTVDFDHFFKTPVLENT